MTLAAGTRLGSYEIVAPLGAGGMGEVYRARDARLGREVALKVLPEEVSGDRDRLARFEQEARSASALNHPNIVTVYEVGESGGTSFIAMELVEGRTLRELCASGPMPIRRILAVAAQAADGLAKAHSAGIVHRDLKPENLMVSKDGFVKILDFGLSKLAAPESGGISAMPTVAKPETQPGTVLGTVAYMSPEQASGQAVDYRSDQFSLGSILHEALTGEKTFAHNTAAETMAAIIRDDPAPLSQRRPETPPPLRWIVERCLAKDPEERYASTRDLARDLAAARDRISEITSGGQAPSIARGRRSFALRPRALLTAIAILAAVLLAGWAAVMGLRQRPSAPTFHRLSFRPGQIGNARFAPDGQTIIFGASYEGETTRGLYQTRPESPESRRFEFADADILSIAPSGEMAIVLGLSSHPRRTVLARVPLSGGVPREVLEGVDYDNADWSPDGKNFAVVRQVGGRFSLEHPIGKILFETPGRLDAPRFSPSGKEIAFFQLESAPTSVVVVPSSGGPRRVLSAGWVAAYGAPVWSPDGREVWFTALSSGSHAALYAVSRSGRERLVTRLPGDLELEDISRDGRALVAHHSHFVTVMGAAPGEAKERNLSWLDESVPADLSADGRKLVISEEGEGGGPGGAVYLRSMDGSPPVRLGDGAAVALSPDGRQVVARTGFGRGEKPHLVLLSTGAGEARILPNEGFADISWANWLPDSRALVVAAAEPGRESRLYVQDIAGGKTRPISAEGFRLSRGNSVSPDGKLVAGIRRDYRPVLLPVDGGEPREISGLTPGDSPIQWTADGGALYVYRRGEIPAKVFLYDLATGQKRPWKEIRPADPLVRGIIRLLMTPDGHAYVYETYRFTSELYVVEGLK